jgi:type III restriction enzyme
VPQSRVRNADPKAKEAKKQKGSIWKAAFAFDEGRGVSTEAQQYDPTSNINGIRRQVDEWRQRPNSADWHVTPETVRLLRHWRSYGFTSIRPFFCQVEAVETLIWLTEVAPHEARAKRSPLPILSQPLGKRPTRR